MFKTTAGIRIEAVRWELASGCRLQKLLRRGLLEVRETGQGQCSGGFVL